MPCIYMRINFVPPLELRQLRRQTLLVKRGTHRSGTPPFCPGAGPPPRPGPPVPRQRPRRRCLALLDSPNCRTSKIGGVTTGDRHAKGRHGLAALTGSKAAVWQPELFVLVRHAGQCHVQGAWVEARMPSETPAAPGWAWGHGVCGRTGACVQSAPRLSSETIISSQPRAERAEHTGQAPQPNLADAGQPPARVWPPAQC